MTDKIADKIAALLRKAESTDSPHEAEALTAAAEKLMLKHGIERAMLDLDPKHKQEQIVERLMLIEGAAHIRRAKVDAIHSITLALGLRSYYLTLPGKTTRVYIVGFESDADDAVTLISSLMLQCDIALVHWWKSLEPGDRRGGYDRMIMHRDYVRGFGWGAGRRIRQERREAAAATAAEESLGTGVELVLADRTKKVDEFVGGLGLRGSRAGGGRQSVDASAAGSVDGANANTGGKAIGRGRGIAQ